jgi:rhodanese-related sulfurtransferase
VPQVSAKQAVDAIKASQGVVVDIRSKSESGISKVPGAVNVARDAIAENASKLSKSSPLYLLDTSGYFSQQVCV